MQTFDFPTKYLSEIYIQNRFSLNVRDPDGVDSMQPYIAIIDTVDQRNESWTFSSVKPKSFSSCDMGKIKGLVLKAFLCVQKPDDACQ